MNEYVLKYWLEGNFGDSGFERKEFQAPSDDEARAWVANHYSWLGEKYELLKVIYKYKKK